MSLGYNYLLDNGKLAQGSRPPEFVKGLPFDVIVLAAREWQPELSGYEVIRVLLDDSGPPPTPAERIAIRQNARRVAHRIRAGKRVLVTCVQGRNRSGVIAGLALVELGLPPKLVVQQIRRIRDGLANPYFRAMVESSRGVSNRAKNHW